MQYLSPRRPTGRTVVISLSVLTVLALFYTLEPRKTAYTCRTFWSCLSGGSRHAYSHPLPADPQIHKFETTVRDGSTKFEMHMANADPDVLFLVLNRDSGSWSSDMHSSKRTIYDFLDMLVATKLNLTTVSVSIMTASADEYNLLKTVSDRLPFARMMILYHEEKPREYTYADRHKPEVQLTRRASIATLRNYLMLRGLEDERHIVWLDADVAELSDGIIQTMISHSETNEDAGIMTARCHQNQMENYDKNAWRLNDASLMGTIGDLDRHSAEQRLVDSRLMVPELINGTADSDIIALDSVGGTILYIRADLVRQGARFPHYNAVGTTWSEFGWSGVETEGLCYVARGLKGGGCYLLGGKHYIRHTDWG